MKEAEEGASPLLREDWSLRFHRTEAATTHLLGRRPGTSGARPLNPQRISKRPPPPPDDCADSPNRL